MYVIIKDDTTIYVSVVDFRGVVLNEPAVVCLYVPS